MVAMTTVGIRGIGLVLCALLLGFGSGDGFRVDLPLFATLTSAQSVWALGAFWSGRWLDVTAGVLVVIALVLGVASVRETGMRSSVTALAAVTFVAPVAAIAFFAVEGHLGHLTL